MEIKLDIITLREKWRQRPDYSCFWSSPDNPKGFRLTPVIQPGMLYVDMKIEGTYSGYPGIAHGGVAFTILDGLMGWYIMAHEARAGFTTECTVSYKRPLLVGRTYRFTVTKNKDPRLERGYNLKGQVFLITTDKEVQLGTESLINMQGSFFLPNLATAKRILGLELALEDRSLFPDCDAL